MTNTCKVSTASHSFNSAATAAAAVAAIVATKPKINIQKMPFLMVSQLYVMVPNSTDITQPLPQRLLESVWETSERRDAPFSRLQNFELCSSFMLFLHSIGKKFLGTCFLASVYILYIYTYFKRAQCCNNNTGVVADFSLSGLHFILGYDRTITSIQVTNFSSSFYTFSDLFHHITHSLFTDFKNIPLCRFGCGTIAFGKSFRPSKCHIHRLNFTAYHLLEM